MRILKFRCWDFCAQGFVENGKGLDIHECQYDGEVVGNIFENSELFK